MTARFGDSSHLGTFSLLCGSAVGYLFPDPNSIAKSLFSAPCPLQICAFLRREQRGGGKHEAPAVSHQPRLARDQEHSIR